MRGFLPPQYLTRRRTPLDMKALLGSLLQRVSFTGRSANEELTRAWEAAVGPEVALHTRVSAFRKNVVYVEVDSATWLHELGGYHKASILEALKQRRPGMAIRDLRFRQRSVRPIPGGGDQRKEV